MDNAEHIGTGLPSCFAQVRGEINERLARYLSEVGRECPAVLEESMKYSVLGEGKRLRAVLPVLICRMLSGRDENVMPVACALEMIHCYSLVHDDLPAMDNDDYRRNLPTTHKKYGEAMGILTGDALLTYSFWLIAEKTPDHALVAPLVSIVADLAGVGGMVSGQVVDMQSQGRKASLEEVEHIHRNKTAALISAACKCGAVAAGASAERVRQLGEYGLKIGLSFQIVDDILDITGTSEILGKTAGKDLAQGKATYPAILGIERARELARELIEQACRCVADIDHNEPLISLARFVIERQK